MVRPVIHEVRSKYPHCSGATASLMPMYHPLPPPHSSTGAIMKAKRCRRSIWHVDICFEPTHRLDMWQCNRARLVFHGWRGWGRPKKEGVVVIRFITCHSLSLLYHFFRILLHSLSYLDLFHRHNFQLILTREYTQR